MISCKDYLLLLGEGITFSDSFERLRPCDDAQKFLWTPARSPLRPHFRSRLRSLLRVGHHLTPPSPSLLTAFLVDLAPKID
ncbi:hypothetical protein H9Q72_004863 [Fusarium xylarioides]|uniref:Uncharacterized protein n=1 Tax=Fusarium xylarioides TaxID=221167 RepID=A0A9P7HWC6_9HYPO|nr:hypothetical protein H9Q72_004863 [Fusarium xylarioides]